MYKLYKLKQTVQSNFSLKNWSIYSREDCAYSIDRFGEGLPQKGCADRASRILLINFCDMRVSGLA